MPRLCVEAFGERFLLVGTNWKLDETGSLAPQLVDLRFLDGGCGRCIARPPSILPSLLSSAELQIESLDRSESSVQKECPKICWTERQNCQKICQTDMPERTSEGMPNRNATSIRHAKKSQENMPEIMPEDLPENMYSISG